nr:biosynthetic peptidoglycan transglycosylase [Halomonas sp.]
MNRDLQEINQNVRNSVSFDFLHGHSKFKPGDPLSTIEIAVLTLEDRRYFSHFGFELRAVPRLLRRYLRTGQLGGISTIEQQVVRIVTGRYDRNVNRKIKELLLAFFINFHLGKREILHFYLNSSYFGYGVVGCNEASQLLFSKDIAMLCIEEAAIIAACLPVPMPRLLVEELRRSGGHISPSSLFKEARHINSRWEREVNFRTQIVLKKSHRVLNNL